MPMKKDPLEQMSLFESPENNVPKLRRREDFEEQEDQILAPFATKSAEKNATRLYIEEEHPYRTNFQRDRDRIVHSRSFRRLKHKRQVFMVTTGDHYRTRLTHTLEVAQISRTMGRTLGLNEDLIEAIALGHDIGHTPFGHIGEVVLHKILRGVDTLDGILDGEDLGGFKHNYQSVRVVDELEKKYVFEGLNLTGPVREGILKHTLLNRHQINYPDWNAEHLFMESDASVTLEGQVVAVADEIAQRTHDLEDGIRAGHVTIRDIRKVDLIQLVEDEAALTPNENEFLYMNSLIRELINRLVSDVLEESLHRLKAFYQKNQRWSFFNESIVAFSKQMDPMQKELDDFISQKIIHRPGIYWADNLSTLVIRQLFRFYLKIPAEMHSYPTYKFFQSNSKETGFKTNAWQLKAIPEKSEFIRLVADYIAGMTDSFAMKEYERLSEIV